MKKGSTFLKWLSYTTKSCMETKRVTNCSNKYTHTHIYALICECAIVCLAYKKGTAMIVEARSEPKIHENNNESEKNS